MQGDIVCHGLSHIVDYMYINMNKIVKGWNNLHKFVVICYSSNQLMR